MVVDCRVCDGPNSVLCFAFVEFTDEEGARNGLRFAGTMLGPNCNCTCQSNILAKDTSDSGNLGLEHPPNPANSSTFDTHVGISGLDLMVLIKFIENGSSSVSTWMQGQKPLSWTTSMKIAVGAARGLEYVHWKANPPVIYRDLKSSNILLDNEFNVKLSDFGLAKVGPVGDNAHVSTGVMGTYEYYALEYAISDNLNLKSEIYSFGVVLLELITWRKLLTALRTKKPGDQNLVAWVLGSSWFLDRSSVAERGKGLELIFWFLDVLWG